MPAPAIAKLFQNGRSQAVRLPREFRFEGTQVLVRREGNDIVLSPCAPSFAAFFDDPRRADEDFLTDRNDTPPQRRHKL